VRLYGALFPYNLDIFMLVCLNEVEGTVDDLNIKSETEFFSLYQLRLKTFVDQNISAEKIDSKDLANAMMHRNDGVFCEMSTDKALTVCSVKYQLTQLLQCVL